MSARLSDLPLAGPSPRLVGSWGEAAARLLRDPQGLFGLVVVLLFVGSAVAAPLIAPFDPDQIDIRSRMQGPSPLHWLGTDQLGRDTLSRVLYGGRIALTIAIVGIGVSLSLGLVLGILAGYGPRWLDSLLLLVMDAVRSFPAVIMAMAVVALTGPSLRDRAGHHHRDLDPELCTACPDQHAGAQERRVHRGRALAGCHALADHAAPRHAQHRRPAR